LQGLTRIGTMICLMISLALFFPANFRVLLLLQYHHALHLCLFEAISITNDRRKNSCEPLMNQGRLCILKRNSTLLTLLLSPGKPFHMGSKETTFHASLHNYTMTVFPVPIGISNNRNIDDLNFFRLVKNRTLHGAWKNE